MERQNQNRENPSMLLEPWREIPTHFVSVYHHTNKEALEPISRQGLTHFVDQISVEHMTAEEKTKTIFNSLCDTFAKKLGKPFERGKAVFAAVDNDEAGTWSHFGDVVLEIKTDPGTTFVYDKVLHTAASIAWHRTPDGEHWLHDRPEQRAAFDELQKQYPESFEFYLEKYLKGRMSLTEYNTLPAEEKYKRISKPEVALPSPVDPKFIRTV